MLDAENHQLVTIILTTLNSERYVRRSIESCLKQTHGKLELLVIDGGSSDRTLEIVNEFKDSRISIIHQPDNAGKLPGALNMGMSRAQGNFITWTQDDCWYEPHAIRMMLDFLASNSEVAFVYTDYWAVDVDGNPMRYQQVKPPDYLVKQGDVMGVSFLFRREVYEEIGPQEVKYYSVHELPWRIKASQAFRLAPLHVPLMYYTVHPDSLTGRFGPWTELRKALNVLLAEKHIDHETYQQRMAKADIDQAYEEYILNRNYSMFWYLVLSGVRRDPRWLKNVGMWKLAFVSLTPLREKYRDRLYHSWKAADDAVQQELYRKHGLRI